MNVLRRKDLAVALRTLRKSCESSESLEPNHAFFNSFSRKSKYLQMTMMTFFEKRLGMKLLNAIDDVASSFQTLRASEISSPHCYRFGPGCKLNFFPSSHEHQPTMKRECMARSQARASYCFAVTPINGLMKNKMTRLPLLSCQQICIKNLGLTFHSFRPSNLLISAFPTTNTLSLRYVLLLNFSNLHVMIEYHGTIGRHAKLEHNDSF